MSEKGSRRKILFVCVGNSCRSQMAEAFANRLGAGKFQAWSAGSHPLGIILPHTHSVLKEKGVSLEGHRSKGLRDVPTEEMDVVVTMGSEVACPLPRRFKGRVIEWEIPDPYGEDLDSYRRVRDLIDRQVTSLLDELQRTEQPG
jgi:arsenate reductase (thioredoxin)